MDGNEVLVPRELLEFLYDKIIGLEDEGPLGEGWKSDELNRAITQLEGLLDTRMPGGL